MSNPQIVIWVDTLSALQECCHDLEQQACFAIDTEFVRQKTYWAKLGLIQIATAKKVFLIDTVVLENLGPFWHLIKHFEGWIVCHAAYQDLEIFWHLAEALPKKIFDTQYATLFCGYNNPPSYGRLVEDIFAIRLDKGQQRSDWLQRPVTEKQQHYAVQDVVHLLPLFDHFKDVLYCKQRFAWYLEDIASLYKPEIFYNSPHDSWQRLKHNQYSEYDLVLLKQLTFWREAEAQKTNQPRQWVLKDDFLHLLVREKPCTLNEWGKVLQKGKPKSCNIKIGEAITYLIRHTLQDETIITNNQIITEIDYRAYEARFHDMRNKVKLLAESHDLPVSLIATVDEIKAFARDPSASIRLQSGWRQMLLHGTSKN